MIKTKTTRDEIPEETLASGSGATTQGKAGMVVNWRPALARIKVRSN